MSFAVSLLDRAATVDDIESPLFFFTTPRTTEIYTLSLHDALPISLAGQEKFRAVQSNTFGAGVASGREIAREFKDRKSTRLNSSHLGISYAVFCLKKKKGDAPINSPVSLTQRLAIGRTHNPPWPRH